ncbi:MAG: cyclophilin-like fold protein [Pseudomonadota bacterium]
MRRRWLLLLAPLLLVDRASARSGAPGERRIWMTVGPRRFEIALTDDAAADALLKRLPISLDFEDLNGNEKHVELPDALPATPVRPGTIRRGDLMLYGSRTLVVFYAGFESSYAYTRLGRVLDPAGLAQALGAGAVRIAFTREP